MRLSGSANGAAAYGLIVGMLAAALLCAIGTTNWLLDPFAMFGRSYARQEDRPAAEGPLNLYARIHKVTRVRELHPDGLILGTSRAEIGLPGQGWPWPEPAYNLAIAGASPGEMLRVLRHGLSLGSYRDLVLTLDFPMSLRSATDDLPDALLEQGAANSWGERIRPRISGPLALLFSHKTLFSAVCIASGERSEHASRIGSDGLELPLNKFALRQSAADQIDYWRRSEAGYVAIYREYAALSDAAKAQRRLRYFADLRSLFELLSRSGARVHLGILPVHPWNLSVMAEAGMWPDYEQWLDRVRDEGIGSLSKEDLNDYTLAGCAWSGPDQEMFVDPSHISPALGGHVLADLLGVEDHGDCRAVANKLTTREALETHLANVQARLRSYAVQKPEEFAAARALVHESVLPAPKDLPLSRGCDIWEKL